MNIDGKTPATPAAVQDLVGDTLAAARRRADAIVADAEAEAARIRAAARLYAVPCSASQAEKRWLPPSMRASSDRAA